MEFGTGVIATLSLGFLLGLKHATDADHVVAVATMVNEYRNALKGVWVGVAWGLGHTTPLLVLGVVVLLFKETLLGQYEVIAPLFELGVGIMLVFLGGQVLWSLRQGLLHFHQHSHDDSMHVHIHATHDSTERPDVETLHGIFHFGKPFFRLKSYAIGVMHGLAGTAAIMIIVLPTTTSFLVGIMYLLLFGVGTIFSMAVITVLLGVPFAVSGHSPRLNQVVMTLAGLGSVGFGVVLILGIALSNTVAIF